MSVNTNETLQGRHTVDGALSSLKSKRDCRVVITKTKEGEVIEKVIEVLKPGSVGMRGDLGNSSNGKIDFLTNYCGYKLKYVSKLTRIEY